MSDVDLADLKVFVGAEGFEDDDGLLTKLLVVAEDFVKDYIRRDLDATDAGPWPSGCNHAVRILVAFWYENREGTKDSADNPVPQAVRDILAPHRDLS